MALRVSWEPTGDPVLDRLGQQFVERVACSARGGSYARRQVKYNTYLNFLEFLAEQFGPEDICNIQPRHVAAFIKHLRNKGRSRDRILGLSFRHPLVARADLLAEVRTARKQDHL